MYSTKAQLESYILKDDTKVVERFFTVPLDYNKPDEKKIRIFARNMIPIKKIGSVEKTANLPYLVYLQGGPGFEVGMASARVLAAQIHERGYQTLWLDQRGTGLSTPVSEELLGGKTDQEKADYLKHFRADNIVRDCEYIRETLLSDKEDEDDKKWTIFGQSFGGFCALTYLSFFPAGLKEVFLTGGLAPIVNHPDVVYAKTIERVIKRNGVYYAKYPQDIKRVRNILSYLDGFSDGVTLPDGGRLIASRWLQMGIKFGGQNGIDEVHELVFRASEELEQYGKFSRKLLQSVQGASSLDGNPIYALLHEAIYCQGQASNWSAARIINNDKRFSWSHVRQLSESDPIFFTGEMIFPDMFETHPALRSFKGTAEILASYKDWGPLYDEDQLARNKVKVTAASYYDDMYVDFDLAQQTAAKVRGTEQFITNQIFHDGLRMHTKEVLDKLFDISKRQAF
ncbi:alpha beta-hydrolase [Pyrrhoderma noxium]|uniref:Alpha beta-hydrolase n=1 Tax=Pyrrhoderma noxium TaxID=2282107 RepID=A0A286UHF8_9AGAM|nr:alpha beta-hydrolase [Pyrrhoderma noxium]